MMVRAIMLNAAAPFFHRDAAGTQVPWTAPAMYEDPYDRVADGDPFAASQAAGTQLPLCKASPGKRGTRFLKGSVAISVCAAVHPLHDHHNYLLRYSVSLFLRRELTEP